MLEDKLTRNERIRLESLNQSVTSFSFKSEPPASIIIDRAKTFEKYIKDEEDTNASE